VKHTGRKLLSALLVLLLVLGLFPASVLAEAAEPDDAQGQVPGFEFVTLSGAGAAQMDTWAAGKYFGAREQLGIGEAARSDPAFQKTSLMVKAMSIRPMD
jgi:hypothetical protein